MHFFQIFIYFFPSGISFRDNDDWQGKRGREWIFFIPHKHSEIYLQLGISINQNPNVLCSIFIGALTKWTDSEIKASE